MKQWLNLNEIVLTDAVIISSLERTDWKNECLKVDIAAASRGETECNKLE